MHAGEVSRPQQNHAQSATVLKEWYRRRWECSIGEYVIGCWREFLQNRHKSVESERQNGEKLINPMPEGAAAGVEMG